MTLVEAGLAGHHQAPLDFFYTNIMTLLRKQTKIDDDAIIHRMFFSVAASLNFVNKTR